MSFPPPPGLNTSSTTSQQHPSLPARPPPPASGSSSAFKPAFGDSSSFSAGYNASSSHGSGRSTGSHGVFTSFAPRSVAVSHSSYRTQTSAGSGSGSASASASASASGSASPASPAGFSAARSYPSSSYASQSSYQPTSYYSQADSYQTQYAVPQIQNPFPSPAATAYHEQGAASVDPDMEAQIAQWQSAYYSKDDTTNRTSSTSHAKGAASATGANYGPVGSRQEISAPALSNAEIASAARESGVANVVTGKDGKQRTVIRSGGGKTWSDGSLLEWDPAHFRLFVGNLAGEVTDDSLLKAFSKYKSVQKARVIRDKRTVKSKGTTMSKGYGFVSFSDGDDYFRAAREMQGKYIGSHPVLLKRSTTEIRPVVPNNSNGKKGGKWKNSGGQNGHANKHYAGVQKKHEKTKGGLKLLG